MYGQVRGYIIDFTILKDALSLDTPLDLRVLLIQLHRLGV